MMSLNIADFPGPARQTLKTIAWGAPAVRALDTIYSHSRVAKYACCGIRAFKRRADTAAHARDGRGRCLLGRRAGLGRLCGEIWRVCGISARPIRIPCGPHAPIRWPCAPRRRPDGAQPGAAARLHPRPRRRSPRSGHLTRREAVLPCVSRIFRRFGSRTRCSRREPRNALSGYPSTCETANPRRAAGTSTRRGSMAGTSQCSFVVPQFTSRRRHSHLHGDGSECFSLGAASANIRRSAHSAGNDSPPSSAARS